MPPFLSTIRPTVSINYTYAGLFGLALLIATLLWQAPLDLTFPSQIQDGLTIFLGITIEALPYIVIGAVIAAIIRNYVSPQRLLKLIPKQAYLAFPTVSLLGLLLPICECGNMPVARSLIRQGLKPGLAITFLLAAPIINPAVIITTYAAFRTMPELMISRFVVGAIIAMAVGFYFYQRGDRGLLLAQEEEQFLDPEHCQLNHHTSFLGEFLEMFGALTFGAAIAALLQVVAPYQLLANLTAEPVIAILAMMALAFVISICSTVDAFFALSYATIFPPSALLAFLVFGPMVDIKAISLMSRTWKPRTILILCLLVAQLTLLISLSLHYLNLL